MRKILAFVFIYITLCSFATNYSFQRIVVSAGSGTLTTVPLTSPPDFIWLYPTGGGTVSLSTNLELNTTGTAPTGTHFQIYWRGGDFDLNGHTFTIFGVSFSQWELDDDALLEVDFKGSSPTIQQIIPKYNLHDTASLDGGSLVPLSVYAHKIKGGSGNTVLLSSNTTPSVPYWDLIGNDNISDTSVDLSKLQTVQSGQIPIGNGTNGTLVPRNISGAITINSLGVAGFTSCQLSCSDTSSLVATQSYVNNLPGALQRASLTLDSAKIVNIFSTPLQIVASPGLGKTIVCSSGTVDYTFNSTAYTTHTVIGFQTNTATTLQMGIDILAGTVTKSARMTNQETIGATDTQLISNQPLMVAGLSGNPAAGNSTATLTVWYFIK